MSGPSALGEIFANRIIESKNTDPCYKDAVKAIGKLYVGPKKREAISTLNKKLIGSGHAAYID